MPNVAPRKGPLIYKAYSRLVPDPVLGVGIPYVHRDPALAQTAVLVAAAVVNRLISGSCAATDRRPSPPALLQPGTPSQISQVADSAAAVVVVAVDSGYHILDTVHSGYIPTTDAATARTASGIRYPLGEASWLSTLDWTCDLG